MDGTLPSPAPRTLTVRRVGETLALTLTDELLNRLHLSEGGMVVVSDTPAGVVLTPLDPETERQVQLGLEFMDEYDETFRALAR